MNTTSKSRFLNAFTQKAKVYQVFHLHLGSKLIEQKDFPQAKCATLNRPTVSPGNSSENNRHRNVARQISLPFVLVLLFSLARLTAGLTHCVVRNNCVRSIVSGQRPHASAVIDADGFSFPKANDLFTCNKYISIQIKRKLSYKLAIFYSLNSTYCILSWSYDMERNAPFSLILALCKIYPCSFFSFFPAKGVELHSVSCFYILISSLNSTISPLRSTHITPFARS